MWVLLWRAACPKRRLMISNICECMLAGEGDGMLRG